MKKRHLAAGATALALLAIVAAIADARPGGGQSYRGGGGHSSGGGGYRSGGGGGGGGGGGEVLFELIYWTIRLIFVYPIISVPIIAIVLVWVIWSARQQAKMKDWDSGPPVPLRRAIDANALRRVDPDFSQAVFEDFAFRLFSAAQTVRSPASELDTIAPYLSPRARAQLASRYPGEEVTGVVVGAMRFTRVDVPAPPGPALDGLDVLNAAPPPPPRARIFLELEANVSTAKRTSYTVESWVLGRDASARSKPPGISRTFPCPNCGAPWQSAQTGTQVCSSCGQAVDNGRFDWVVEDIGVASEKSMPPTLLDDVPEFGTDLPTYHQAAFEQQWAQLAADDPEVTQAAVTARLNLIYAELNAAWSNNHLEPVRGLVSDGLYDYLQYWVDAYKTQKLRNQLVDMRILKVTFAKLVRDRYYDALTVRLWGIGKDFVVGTESGKLLRGSKSHERAYSEYWTLIRAAGRRGAPHAEPSCGNCGAPLDITMAGECEHCGAHVTSGEFDWVLSKIEQDDSYRG